uniref:J domain-containing protein n=1 Tax=Strigamia maritima TaxID=126957 RepID=T1JIC7_STRMM
MFPLRKQFLRALQRAFSTGSGKDLYDILGIKSTASQDEIKSAYYIMSKRYHPDRSKGLPDGAKRFVEIAQAYEILSNESMRKKYDSGGMDVPSIEIPRDESNVKMEPRFRNKSASFVRTEPTPADFSRWTKAQYDGTRAKQFKSGQKNAARKQMEEDKKFGTGLEIILVALIVVGFAVAIFHPFVDDSKSKKPRS